MAWLKQQHRALWQFYRNDFCESLLITAAAFLVICLLSFGVGLINKAIPETVVDYFSQMLQNSNIISDDGAIDLPALFGNNVRATLVSVLYGFIPFIYLTALALGMNALIANVICWVVCVLFQYFTNRTWVFDGQVDSAAGFLKQMASFFGGRLFTLVVEEAILAVFITWLGFNSMAVKLVAQVVVIVLNYVISKLIVFKK